MALSQRLRDSLLSEAQARVRAADGGGASTLANQRDTAQKYYRGDLFGNEMAGRSSVVSRDVAQYIDSQMPGLMRVFSSGDEVVVFEPTQPGDEEAAKQATDYVNWIWRQNEGFLRFHNWFKDGLLFKLGTVKIWWDDTPDRTREVYRGLSDEQLAALKDDDDIEVSEVVDDTTIVVGPDGMPMLAVTHDATVVKINRTGRVRVENVPPEEFLFGRRTKDDRESEIFGHQTSKPRADLIAMGFDRDEVENLSSSARQDDMSQEKIVRFRDVDDMSGSATVDADMVELVEAYFRWAPDDRPSRLWQVTYSGSTLLSAEEVDDHPFACLTPILMPHRLVGLSTADQTMDIQLVKSTIWRQMLDNMYLTTTPQMGAVEGQVNLEDLTTRRPGGVVRMKSAGGLVPIPTQPLGQEPYQMIEYLDAQGEQRTGTTRYNQGIDADSLNKTASGINMIQNAGAQRQELIARVYAETGVKRAFRRILALVQQHQTKPQMVRLRGQWVPMDPRAWSNAMDMTVTVGLGTGNKDQTMAHMMSLLQFDQIIVGMQGGVQGPLVTADNIYAKLKKLIEAAGLRSVEQYYSDPSSPKMQQAMANQPEKPDPKAMEVQAKIQLEQVHASARLATDKMKSDQEIALARERGELEAALSQQQANLDGKIAQDKSDNEAAMAREKAALDAELQERKAMLDVAERHAEARSDENARQMEMIADAVKAHSEMMMEDRRERERLTREHELALATAAIAEEKDDDDMAKGPSDEYRAMATMAHSMMQAVEKLTGVAESQQDANAQMVALMKKMAAPRRVVRDDTGRLVGSEAAE